MVRWWRREGKGVARGDVGGQVRQRKRGIRGKAEMAKQREGHLERGGWDKCGKWL